MTLAKGFVLVAVACAVIASGFLWVDSTRGDWVGVATDGVLFIAAVLIAASWLIEARRGY